LLKSELKIIIIIILHYNYFELIVIINSSMSKIQGWNFEFMLTKADFGWNIMFILGWCSREVYISLLVLWGKHSNAPKCDGYTASCVGKMLLAQNNFFLLYGDFDER